MNYKWLGAVLVVVGCGGFGFSAATSHRREEGLLRLLLFALDRIQCRLMYQLTPLPELARQVGKELHGPLKMVFVNFAEELEHQISPDAYGCMANALDRAEELPDGLRLLLSDLGRSFGELDLPGQIRGLEGLAVRCRSRLDSLGANRDVCLRCYRTLGICTGLALAILFV